MKFYEFFGADSKSFYENYGFLILEDFYRNSIFQINLCLFWVTKNITDINFLIIDSESTQKIELENSIY